MHFTQPDGRPDRAHLAARAESLAGWLRMAIEAPLDEPLSAYLAGIGRAHTRRGGSPAAPVRGRYLVVTMSFVQTALIGLLDPAIADRGELLRTIAAWNKLLMIHLDLFLAVYGSAEGNPHWYWDRTGAGAPRFGPGAARRCRQAICEPGRGGVV